MNWFLKDFRDFGWFWLILVGSGRFYMVRTVFNGLGWCWLISVGSGNFFVVLADLNCFWLFGLVLVDF